jgi:hypothetical protein
LGDLFVNSVLNPRWVSSVRKTGRNLLAQTQVLIKALNQEESAIATDMASIEFSNDRTTCEVSVVHLFRTRF